MNLTYKEIKSQYTAIRQTFDYMHAKRTEINEFFSKVNLERIIYIGCGSGYCLCRSAAMSASVRLGINSIPLAAGDLMLNAKAYAKLIKDSIIISPTRSGSTSEVINAVEAAKENGMASFLALSCVNEAPIAPMADFALELPWAFDESVCQTRTVSNLYTANLLLIAMLSKNEALIADIDRMISAGEGYISEYEASIKQIAQRNFSNVVVLADGEAHGVAQEGALAITEIAQIKGSAHHVLDVRHGPIVMIDESSVVIILLSKEGKDYQKQLIKDIKAKNATIITYGDNMTEKYEEADLHVESNIGADTAVCAVPFLLIPQLLAYYSSEKQGINSDSPSGLDPWIKL